MSIQQLLDEAQGELDALIKEECLSRSSSSVSGCRPATESHPGDLRRLIAESEHKQEVDARGQSQVGLCQTCQLPDREAFLRTLQLNQQHDRACDAAIRQVSEKKQVWQQTEETNATLAHEVSASLQAELSECSDAIQELFQLAENGFAEERNSAMDVDSCGDMSDLGQVNRSQREADTHANQIFTHINDLNVVLDRSRVEAGRKREELAALEEQRDQARKKLAELKSGLQDHVSSNRRDLVKEIMLPTMEFNDELGTIALSGGNSLFGKPVNSCTVQVKLDGNSRLVDAQMQQSTGFCSAASESIRHGDLPGLLTNAWNQSCELSDRGASGGS